ncbi:hypothetical protein ACQR09_06005 [Bradyrhizobium oligotrophicum]|uniref:hypothetical protein n=1 Tax=Bradyrhizobium oligotrophicum TaxID=44255 RepID=UPI003EB717DD
MDIVTKYGAFVNDQIQLQEKMANKFGSQEWRRDRHLATKEIWKNLLDDLVLLQSRLEDIPEKPKPTNVQRNTTLTMEDIEGLPPELMQELSISEADRLEFTIVGLINEAGGIMSLDKLIIGLYKKTGEIHRRSALTSRIYRMIQKKLIFSVPFRKGIYSTQELSDDDVRALFGVPDSGEEDESIR